MRIAIVHSFYGSGQPSGENRVVVDQAGALMRAGHDVLLLGRSTDLEQARRLYPLRAATRVATGVGPDPTKKLEAFQPDVVHLHNLFPNVGTRWLATWDGPIAASVHNYRAVCANGLLFRDGHVCTECPDIGQRRSIVHRCYRDSVLATVPLAVSRSSQGLFVLRRADAVITTSRVSDEVIRRLVPGVSKTHVVPNFGAPRPAQAPVLGEQSGWLAMGRFSPEKGLAELARDWPADEALDVIGSGPELGRIAAAARGKNITIVPTMDRSELRSRLSGYLGFVFPSLWFEVAPQVALEAMRVGLPIVAHEANAVSELVESTGCGAIYHDRESLRLALGSVTSDRALLHRRAVEAYDAQFSEEEWLRSMTALYSTLIKDEPDALG